MAGTKHSGGRNRKSGHAHVLLATFRADRHGAAAPSPEAPGGQPDARDLTGEALAEWNRMIVRLEALGTLSAVDDAALRRYALLHAETEAISAEPRRLALLSGRLLREARRLEGSALTAAVAEIVGLEKLRARHLQQSRQGAQALRQWLVEFGLTPAARTRVQVGTGGKPSMTDPKKARYLDGLTRTS